MNDLSTLHYRPCTSGYGWSWAEPKRFAKTMQEGLRQLRKLKKKHKFDAIVVTGTSGFSFAIIATYETRIPIINIRKETKKQHHGLQIESNAHCCKNTEVKKYLIVDDFIDTGRTIRRIYNKIKKEAKARNYIQPECVGVLLWQSNSGRTWRKDVRITENLRLPVFHSMMP